MPVDLFLHVSDLKLGNVQVHLLAVLCQPISPETRRMICIARILVDDVLNLSLSGVSSLLYRGSSFASIFMPSALALGGSSAKKLRATLPVLLNGLNFIDTSVR